MVEGCGLKCMKALLFIFNFIFWLSGIALCGVGIWITVDGEKFIGVLDNPLVVNSAYMLIAAGAVVIAVGFCGCCGAIKESRCLLGCYFVFLLIIFLVELSAGILASIYGAELESYVITSANKTLMEDYGNVKYVTDAWNEAQLIFECCGVYGYEDYQETSWFESSPLAYPVTCCKIVNYKSATPVDPEKCYEMENVDWAGKYMNTRGCINQFQSWVHDNVYILGGVSIGVACLQLFGMIFAICLCRNIGDDD